MTDTARFTATDVPMHTPPWSRVARHYTEMLIAMFVGMLVVGWLRAAAGLTVAFAEHPGWSFLLMATDMSLGMAAWMRFRRHGWASTLEMCAVMYLPLLLLPLLQAEVVSRMTFMIVAHVVMSVAMLAVLVRRRRELTHC